MQPGRDGRVRCSAWFCLGPESENVNVGEINGIALLGLLKLKLSCEIGPLLIHRKVVINGESGAVVVSVASTRRALKPSGR